MDALNLKCGQCGHINELPANWSQPVAFCAKCGHKIPVPRREDSPSDVVEDLPGQDDVGFAEQARNSEGRKVSITCPQCGKTVSVGARVAGRKARCKACDAPMDIPYPDDLVHLELPRPRNDAKETGLDLVAPGEMSASHRASVPPDDRESMLDLLPEPIQYAADDEGTHEPLPVVIPLSQQAVPARPQRLPHRRSANGTRPAPEAAPAPATKAPVGVEAQPQPPSQASSNLAGLTEALPPEPQIPSPEAGQLANAMKDFQAGKEAVLARRSRAARLRSGIYLAVAAVLCSAMIGLAVMLWPVFFPEPRHFVDITNKTPRPGPDGGPATPVGGVGKQVSSVKPATPPTIASAAPGPAVKVSPSPQPAPQQPRCDVVALATTTLGPGGYYPAALGSIYWKMTAEIKAGTDSIAFRAMGKDVQLVFAGKAVDSLGIAEDTPVGQGPLPRLARQETISVKPGQSRKVTLLFEVPVGISEGELVIGKLRWPFRTKSAVEPIPPASLAGTFVEVAPRNLQPMLADPVMSAIQSAGQQQLAVRPNGSGLEVEIPQAHVYGLAKPAGQDVYGVGLAYGEYKLAANLRFVDGGRTAILYLADKPFHQITYINQSASSPPKPAAPATSSPATSSPAASSPATSSPAASQPTTADTSTPEDATRRRPPRTVTMPKGAPDRDKATDLPRGKSIFD